jgi:AbrB family looped-hinge helix DNA binding protein
MAAKTKLIVSARGQVTLPMSVRKKLGIVEGAVITLEERRGEIVLKPATVFEVEYYTDQQIQEWLKDDKVSTAKERKLLSQKLQRLQK